MSDGPASSRPPRDDGAETEAPSFGDTLKRWLRSLAGGAGEADLRESLEEVLDEHAEEAGPLDPDQRQMLFNILQFGELRVDDVMVPRPDIVAIQETATLPEVVEAFRSARHSRLPVFRDSLDDITGFVHIKDIVDYWGDGRSFRLNGMVREILAVPPSMRVLELLAKMRQTRVHMALVVDEYGGADGLVTIEDIVEEIVGDIEDEHDTQAEPTLTEQPDGSYLADGRLEIEAFEEAVGVDLLPDDEDEDVATLGGLLFQMLGRVPEPGETVTHAAGLEFEVLETDQRRVLRVAVRRLPDPETAQNPAA